MMEMEEIDCPDCEGEGICPFCQDEHDPTCPYECCEGDCRTCDGTGIIESYT